MGRQRHVIHRHPLNEIRNSLNSVACQKDNWMPHQRFAVTSRTGDMTHFVSPEQEGSTGALWHGSSTDGHAAGSTLAKLLSLKRQLTQLTSDIFENIVNHTMAPSDTVEPKLRFPTII